MRRGECFLARLQREPSIDKPFDVDRPGGDESDRLRVGVRVTERTGDANLPTLDG